MPKLGKGITNDQAKYLAALCRETKTPYCGSGMSRQEASLAIETLKRKVADRQRRLRRELGG